MTNIYNLIDDYINTIKESSIYKEYVNLVNKVNKDYKDIYIELLNYKNKFDDVMKYGKHHPDYSETVKTYQNLRIKYYNNLDVKRMNELRKLIEEKVNNFLKEITNVISSNIPVINELGLMSNNFGGLSCGNF